MNVKRYIANDVQEAMQKIKQELGRDAVILHTRKIKQSGLKKWFSKPLVEVVAAVDEQVQRDRIEQISAVIQQRNQAKPDKEDTVLQESRDEIKSLKTQMAEITALLSTVIEKVNQPQTSQAPQDQGVHPAYKQLIEQDICKQAADKIFQIAGRQVSIKDANDATIKNALKVIIRDMVGLPFKIEPQPEKGQRVFFFVGPTGVGKTTTLAKIAAKLSLIEGKKVGLVTADTYRIAAVDQLKTYSEILGIPLEVIYEADELKPVLKKHKDKDYILIDTAGRNHKSDELEKDLQGLFEQSDHSDIFLVISLTTGYKDVVSILNSYHFLPDFKLIFTKLDEAESVGNIINAKLNANKPIAFITNGQSVPDDIDIADPDQIANWLIGE